MHAGRKGRDQMIDIQSGPKRILSHPDFKEATHKFIQVFDSGAMIAEA
jgi:hypothetical protein